MIVLFIIAAGSLKAQTLISSFKFDSNPVTTASAGPNAISVSSSAGSTTGGVNNTNGLNPKAQGEKQDINLTIPGSPTFDVPGIDISINYRRNESDAYFFTRGSSMNFGMTGGMLNITYRVASATTFSTVTSGGVYTIPSDDTYRTYRFIYTPGNGKGYLLVNGTVVWSFDGPDGRPLYWEGSGNVIMGQLMDGNGANKAMVDNFTVYSLNITSLPIELTSFNAERNADNKVDLSWTTSSERNNDFFTVERSLDGTEWEAISTVPGAGNSTVKRSYATTDENPVAGVQYYRLKQTDYDGKNETFEVLSVEIPEQQISMQMYPNPTTGVFTVSSDAITSANDTEIRVINAMGTVVLERSQVTENRNVIDLTDFNSGTYIVEVIADGQATRSMLLKN